MKKIGIVGYPVGSIFGVGISYIEYINDLDGEPIILAPTSAINETLDLLIIPGGADVNPVRYGAIPSFQTSKPEPIREYFDTVVLPEYIGMGVPIFGICRGLQTIAVHFGCKLIQDMHHETNPEDDPYKAVHGINIIGQKNGNKIKVNSRHHQSVIINKNDMVVPLATHEKIDHHIEAIAIRGYPIRAVQFHPEDMYDSSGLGYARMLIKQIMK